MAWDAHESCWAKRPGRKAGQSAVAAPSVEREPLEDEEENGDGHRDGVDVEVDAEQDVHSSVNSKPRTGIG